MISVKELIKHYENMNKYPSRIYETEESDVIMNEIESDQNENSLGKVNDLINYWETIENGEESVNTFNSSVEQREYTFKYCPLSFDTKVTFVKVRNHLLFLLKGKESDICLKPSELINFFKYNPPNGLMDQSTVRFIINRSE